jgi:hypothetical protein
MEHIQSLPLGMSAHTKVVESPDKNKKLTFNGRPGDARVADRIRIAWLITEGRRVLLAVRRQSEFAEFDR